MAIKKPVLSIGMIVKNESRCLERCLKALQPLRDAIPSELIIADTGSTDNTREIAERYADIVFEFEWINDFAAARNAVIDRASGIWYLSVDADETMDEDISKLKLFLEDRNAWVPELCAVTVRSYSDWEMKGSYSDFMAVRLFRRNGNICYEGIIHEHLVGFTNGRVLPPLVVLHHDGYVGFSGEEGAEKRKRNLALLEQQLEKDPDNLITLLQCIESSSEEVMDYIYRAVEGVESRRAGWEIVGAPIYRHAVIEAQSRKISEVDKWVERMETLFPDSLFTCVDVAAYMFLSKKESKDWESAVYWGEKYLKGFEELRKHDGQSAELMWSPLKVNPLKYDQIIRLSLSEAYRKRREFRKSLLVMEELKGETLEAVNVSWAVYNLYMLHNQCELDVSPMLRKLWEEINSPIPQKEAAGKRKAAFFRSATKVFSSVYQKEERAHEDFFRPGYTLFADFTEQPELCAAARILGTRNGDEMEHELSKVENWDDLPIWPLAYALEHGVIFPPRDKPLYMEVMDGLALKLKGAEECYLERIIKTVQISEDPQQLSWARSLIFASMTGRDWKAQRKEENRHLLRLFLNGEQAFLHRVYRNINETSIFSLPPMDRLGWYLIQADEAYTEGDKVDYIRLLKKALTACGGMRYLIEYLLDEFYEEEKWARIGEVSPELLDLANQVKTMLAQFPEEHPAVQELKQSKVYKEVAFLLEDTQKGVLS